MNPDTNQVPNLAPAASNPLQAGAVGQASPAAPSGVHASAGGAAGEAVLQQAVHQAQAIVQRTGQDPYAQVVELEKLKAVYLNTRYGKSIRLSNK
jgi:hypothetical protein